MSSFDVVEWLVGGFIVVVVLLVLLGFFVYAPYALYSEAKCLKAGYPVASITYDLSAYCITLDGQVTVRVDEI